MAAALAVPSIETPRYRLRQWTSRDVAVVEEAGQDDYITAITTVPRNGNTAACTEFIHRQWQRSASGTGYSFAVATRLTDTAVGQLGVWLRDIDKGRVSLGYWIAPSGRGRGAAAEALTHASRWAQTTLGVPRLELYVEPWNTASSRTAEKCGYRREGLLRAWESIAGIRRDMYMYSLTGTATGVSV